MVSREDDRIVYDDAVDEIEAVRCGPFAVGLAVLALVAGVVYVGWTPGSGPSQDSRAHETSGPIATPKSGFDASSSEINACDRTAQTLPDFSIVVAGTAVDGQQVVARVVRFVVVNSNHDVRHGPGVQPQSLCTLP